uniref:Vexin n=1 Tax=Bos taurus TaxID=9913 RepID=A0ABI0P1S9_BOVIN
MHQIYSCSDENIEVFTTVIPSKVTSPARRRVKSSQHLLTKNVVIESDLYAPRPVELLPHRTDRRDGEGRWSGRFQNPRLQGPHPAKTPARPVGTSEPKSANLCGNRTYGKALMPPVARISVKAPTVLEAAAPGSENVAVLTRGITKLGDWIELKTPSCQSPYLVGRLNDLSSCSRPSQRREFLNIHQM